MKSIRFKILTMAFAITLLAATVIAIYGTYSARKMVVASNEAYITSLSSELALEMDNFMQFQKGYLEGQVNALTLANDYSEAYISEFTYNMSLANTYMLYSYFNTLTDSGHFTSSDGWIPPDDYSWENRYWVKQVAEMEDVFVDFPSYDSGTGNIVTVIRKRVHDGEVQGILNMAINLNELSLKLQSYKVPSRGEAFLVDENGLLVAHHDPGLFLNQPEALEIIDIIPEFKMDQPTFELQGYTYISSQLKDAPWILWVRIPTAFFDKGVNQTSLNFLYIFLVTFLITQLIASAMSKRISGPILKLKYHANAMEKGDYTEEISDDLMHQRDEIGRFATTFQNMKTSILQREDELKHNYMEIQALYEEMAASEEALRENYDALNHYKDKVEFYAFHNAQTGFYNRDYLVQTLSKLSQQQSIQDMALIYMSFKELSHYLETVGQTILEMVHYRLGVAIDHKIKNEIMLESTLLFDLSLGKFAILIDASRVPQMEQIISEIRDLFLETQVLDSLVIKMTIVCGGTLINETLNDLNACEAIIEQAESAMIRNQSEMKRHQVITWFDDEMLSKRFYEMQIESGIFEALKRNEISVVYQPQVDQKGSIIGLEALMRWTHGKLGNIPPAEFIHRAETLGVIDQLDHFMLEEVLKFQNELKQDHQRLLPIAINISVVEMLDSKFISRVEAEVDKFDLPRNGLIFELTETAFSKHLALVKDTIFQLMTLGYQVHLDDFGTGYSSLSYLSEFPVNAIKIDRSFVEAFIRQPKYAKVISTIVDLADRLDAQLIAEGVETESQYSGLAELGCHYYQGYYFSKPMAKEEIMKLLDKKSAE